MRIDQTLYFVIGLVTTIHALTLPAAPRSWTGAGTEHELFRRKGGGRGGSGSGSSGGGSRSGSPGTTGTSGSSRGVAPSYGGGRYYGGGATSAYSSGTRSPGGITPYFLGAGALAFLPGIWLYGAYAYAYPHVWLYYNETTNRNETLPARCYCARYENCGCDDNNDYNYRKQVANNNSLATVADVNGTQTLVVNGTLPNGTESATGAAGHGKYGLLKTSGWWVIGGGAAYAVWAT